MNSRWLTGTVKINMGYIMLNSVIRDLTSLVLLNNHSGLKNPYHYIDHYATLSHGRFEIVYETIHNRIND